MSKADTYRELLSVARELEWLPSRYTHAPGENSARVVELLYHDIYSIARKLREAAERVL